MESLVSDESLSDKCDAPYLSAMSSLSGARHPLSPTIVTTPADSDPLLSPPQPPSPSFQELREPDAPDNSYTDPLSSADEVFSPFEGDARNGVEIENCRRKSDDSSTSLEYMNIAVTDPQREPEISNSIVPGGNTHVTYLITTRTSTPELGKSKFSVRRRFKEVVALSERLSESYRGFLIPPRPDKNVVEGQVMHKQEFVEQRRLALEKYLRRLASHPFIKKGDDFRSFLQVQGTLPLPTSSDAATTALDGAVNLPRQLFDDSAAAVAPHQVSQPAKSGRDLLRMLKELKLSVSNDWRGSSSPVIEEDKGFHEKKEKLHDLEQQLTHTSQQAESLVKAQQDIGATMGDLGLAFIKLTKFENEAAMFSSQRTRAAMMKSVATTAVKASRLYRGLNTRAVEHLDTLHEYLGLMLAVQGAFSHRSRALLTVQNIMSKLSSLNAKAEKLEATPSKISDGDNTSLKIEELKESIRVTEEARQRAVREYEWIKGNITSELERFDRERHADLWNMLKGFANSQVDYAERMASVWGQVAEETSGYSKESR